MTPNQKAANAILKHLRKSVENNTTLKLTNGMRLHRNERLLYTECAVFANDLGSMSVVMQSDGALQAIVNTARGTGIRYTLTKTTVDADTLAEISNILNTIISQQQGPTIDDVVTAALQG